MLIRMFCCFLLPFFSTVLSAETLFTENFEAGLGQWDDTYNGLNAQIVNDPIVPGNKVLNFSALTGGGDLMSILPLQGQTGGNYIISFDYLGTCGTANCGGFIGISVGVNPPGSHTWIGGTTAPYPDLLPDDGAWHRVIIPVTTTYNSFHLMLEEWNGTGGIAGDALFDNFIVTDANGPTITPAEVPIPIWTWFLLASGLIFISIIEARKKTNKSKYIE